MLLGSYLTLMALAVALSLFGAGIFAFAVAAVALTLVARKSLLMLLGVLLMPSRPVGKRT